jgi:hypothetical protein
MNAISQSQMPMWIPGMKVYEYPYCLSVVLIKVQDLIYQWQSLKKEHKVDVEIVRNIFFYCIDGDEVHNVPEMPHLQDAKFHTLLFGLSVLGSFHEA